jgi:hypothetical protein
MGFNRRKMEDQRREAAEKEAAARRATDAQVLEDAERLIAAWNERQAKRMPMLFSPTIGAAITARFWFLWVRCPACRTINAISIDWGGQLICRHIADTINFPSGFLHSTTGDERSLISSLRAKAGRSSQ